MFYWLLSLSAYDAILQDRRWILTGVLLSHLYWLES